MVAFNIAPEELVSISVRARLVALFLENLEDSNLEHVQAFLNLAKAAEEVRQIKAALGIDAVKLSAALKSIQDTQQK
jgi:hypothetical protein